MSAQQQKPYRPEFLFELRALCRFMLEGDMEAQGSCIRGALALHPASLVLLGVIRLVVKRRSNRDNRKQRNCDMHSSA